MSGHLSGYVPLVFHGLLVLSALDTLELLDLLGLGTSQEETRSKLCQLMATMSLRQARV